MKSRPFIAVAALFLLGLVSGTIAFYADEYIFENKFHTKQYGTSVIEEFESPTNWLPGNTTEKRIFAENTGDIAIAVRAKILSEKWVSANGNNLPLTQNGHLAAIIKYAENSDWTLANDGYYYYDRVVEPKQKTTSFMESVTFNPEIREDMKCDEANNSKNCVSTGNGYDGGTYTLTIVFETIQASAREEVWQH